MTTTFRSSHRCTRRAEGNVRPGAPMIRFSQRESGGWVRKRTCQPCRSSPSRVRSCQGQARNLVPALAPSNSQLPSFTTTAISLASIHHSLISVVQQTARLGMRTRRSGSLPLSDPQQPTPYSTTNGHRPPTSHAAEDPSTTNGSPDETDLRTDTAGGSAAEEKGRGRRGGRVRRSSPPSAPSRVDKRKGKAAAGSSPPFRVPLSSRPWDRELIPPSSSQFRILVEVRILSGSRSRCRLTRQSRARRHQPKTKLASLSLPRIMIHKVNYLSHILLRSLTADSFLGCVCTAEGEIAGVKDGELCARNLIARR